MPKRTVPVAFLLCFLPAVGSGQVPLGPEFHVNSQSSGYHRWPSTASDGNGNVMVVWMSDTGDGDGAAVFGQRYDASGARVGTEFQVNTYTTGNQHGPSVAADALGYFLVAWRGPGEVGAHTDIFARVYDPDGTAGGSDFRVNTFITGQQVRPVVAASGDSLFVVVWLSYGQLAGGVVMGRAFDGSGFPLTGEFPVTAPERQPFEPAVARVGTGFVVVWSDANALERDVRAQRFNSVGTPVSASFVVNSYLTGRHTDPAVASLPGGQFVVVWQGQDGDAFGVWGRRFLDSGMPDGGDFQVNVYTTANQSRPVVASDVDGNFVVAWQDRDYGQGQDGSYTGVFARAFHSSGGPGAEFQVNTFTTFSQLYPSIASTSNAQFVVTWQSYAQVGPAGIFGQRFSTDLSLDVIFKDCFSFSPCP